MSPHNQAAVRSRTFCCCIPVRAGVILLSILGILGGTTVAAVGIVSLKKSAGAEKSMIIQIVVYILLAVISFLGLIGGIGRKLLCVRIYFGMLVFHLAFSVGGGIFAIWRVFQDSPNYIKECLLGKEADKDALKTCEAGASLLKGLMITVFILFWALETWACIIVHHYTKQLEEEEATRSVVKDTEAW
ncbi:hypothetical protein FA13DRAFT_1726647 [Coprinellus micaceus]|uniref:Uncharacterized protein n=1 Tax=Coprinellus micaceus TaxID=71717 RepID=A0A4Y7TUD0_COPMI|nr:hypothetical protein FA13DRAFT_1726647 [Coprinellus micaceus]